jgi:DNA-binding response OmpR family regulator
MFNALVIDDTPANLDFFERLLKQAGFNIFGASSGKQAISHLETLHNLRLAVVDMELPDASGLQLTQRIRAMFPQAYIVVATMHDERSLMMDVFRAGGNCFMVKPHGFMELFKRVTTMDLDGLRDGDCTIIDQYGPRTIALANAEN